MRTRQTAHRVAFLPVIAVAALIVLSGCAPTVSLDAAPGANDPGCAAISVRLPSTIAGKSQRETDAQATSAWGSPTVVLLRCGVTPIGPTTQPCISVNGIDWVLESKANATAIRYVTFGRTPATEVIIQHGAGGVSDAAVLPALSEAVGSVKQKAKCLDMADVNGGSNSASASTPSAKPTPSPAPTSSPTPAS